MGILLNRTQTQKWLHFTTI